MYLFVVSSDRTTKECSFSGSCSREESFHCCSERHKACHSVWYGVAIVTSTCVTCATILWRMRSTRRARDNGVSTRLVLLRALLRLQASFEGEEGHLTH